MPNDGSVSKTISLFQYIRELNKQKQTAILNAKDYPWCLALSDLPDDPENIKLFYRDRVEDEISSEGSGRDNVLLSVRKPEFQKCPEPKASFKDWLLTGWDDYHNEPQTTEYIELPPEQPVSPLVLDFKDAEEEPRIELFTDNAKRVEQYEAWRAARSVWMEKQKIKERTSKLFTELYRYYFELRRETETEEIIAANGMLSDLKNPQIHHPVLTHRVKIVYDDVSNTVSVLDTDVPSELYTAVFQAMEDVNLAEIKTLLEDLQKNDYHPLDRNDTPGFLKILTHRLSDSSLFSEQPIPYGEKSQSRLHLCLHPCFIVRKRLDGTLKAVDRIIEDIRETGDIPKPIRDIVSGGFIDVPDNDAEVSIEERLAEVGGESADILLCKEANKEQLEIAKRIELYNAVLVQGPPGTGKTHTIANLMGHFLAQGKSILVTSYTNKALSVLKEKVSPGLQDLCVSLLDDSNEDMEKSIDGITSYMSVTTSYELKREMQKLAAKRRQVIDELADIRKKIYAVINQECNCIVLNGEDISPSKAAAFVVEHAEDLSYIPGNVRLYAPLPLSFEQLSALYRSNEALTAADEEELETELPNPKDIMSPSDFSDIWDRYQYAVGRLADIESQNSWHVRCSSAEQSVEFSCNFRDFSMPYPAEEDVEDLKRYALSFGKIEHWMKVVAVDGKSGSSYRKKWQTLIDAINTAGVCADEYVSLTIGKQLIIRDGVSFSEVKSAFSEMRPIFAEKGKISKLTLMFHSDYEQALSAVTVNGQAPASADDCDIILKYIELWEARQNCRNLWNAMLAPHDVPAFDELDKNTPEKIAVNWIPVIKKYLNWYSADFGILLKKLSAVGIPDNILFRKDIMDSELTATDKILSCVQHTIPKICDACVYVLNSQAYISALNIQKNTLTSGKRGGSSICRALAAAVEKGDSSAYAEACAELEKTYEKYTLLRGRNEALKILEPVAPQWAEAIRTREGIHGACVVPDSIYDAWKWKQLYGIIEDITQKPFAELQAESFRLSRRYREITAEYAQKCGWYHLLRRTEADISMKQALEGWRLTVKRIGKGTGKTAPMLKAKARELMAQCQNAVPCWIMPINKALESLDPRVNKFDIIIIDEASQADISSLAILYMGKKLIIVGDNQQVSPMAIGFEDRKILSLQEQYINDKIPNAHLYTLKTSIYDVAKTTFKPLMLREHFRCVPEIIGFSNMLSYDGKIKPLRDAGNSALLPAIVNYRVAGGKRSDKAKTNRREAETIIALMQACFEQPEYAGKSFGVISMLGDEQVKLIQQLIERRLNPTDVISRNVLCGNSANFQGDERDIIFLSLVDSGSGNGPLNMMNFGPDDSYRKRYNVAVSRARDQIWVVDSLDPANDLKPGDIRKRLIDYSLNPNAAEITREEIKENADSPFEIAVATALSDRGYHLVQQWKVGGYRLDIVAVCGEKKVAVECDGERWHSGEEKIREDMERQTILERIGWRFIRIRGSEFYRDSEKTMERVISELTDYGIEPENVSEAKSDDRETELLKRVKSRAYSILSDENSAESGNDIETIAAALDSDKPMSDSAPSILLEETVVSAEKKVDSGKPAEKFKQLSFYPEVSTETRKADKKQTREKPQPAASSTSHNENVEPTEAKPKAEDRLKKASSPEMPKSGKKNAQSSNCDSFIEELKQQGIQIIDNREKSGIVWVIYDMEHKAFVEETISKFNYRATLEKRGAIDTNNRAAWRVMIGGDSNARH